MYQNKLNFIKEAFPQHEVIFSEDFTCATIINPIYDENLNIYYDECDELTPFTVCFSFQHRHLTEFDVVKWCSDIISEQLFVIEFFKDNQRRFGGEITVDKLADLSYLNLEQFTGYYGSTKLFECADTFKIRGWNNELNLDAEFILTNNGEILIKKIARRKP